MIGFDSNIYEAKFEQRDLIPLDTARTFDRRTAARLLFSVRPGSLPLPQLPACRPLRGLQHSRDISLRRDRSPTGECARRRARWSPGEAAGLDALTGAGKLVLVAAISVGTSHEKALARQTRHAGAGAVRRARRQGWFSERMKAMEQTLGDPGDWFALLTVHAPLDKGKTGEKRE